MQQHIFVISSAVIRRLVAYMYIKKNVYSYTVKGLFYVCVLCIHFK